MTNSPRKSQAKLDAIKSGSKIFVPEVPCRAGHWSRYVSTGDCVECLREKGLKRPKKGRGSAARKLAIEKGEKTFLSERPCRGGHMSPRDTKTSSCLECLKASFKRRYNENKKMFHKRVTEYYNKNPEKRRRLAKITYSRSKARHAKDRMLRIARKLQATPSWVDLGEIQKFYNLAAKLTKETGIRYEVDHIVPLRHKDVCGLHVPWNLRVITREENRKKSNKIIESEIVNVKPPDNPPKGEI